MTLDNDTGREQVAERVVVVIEEGERCIIGRGQSAQVVCNTGACSRHHCAIDVTGGQLYLEDLGSSNGTWLNGQRVVRSPLVPGDIIHAGRPRICVVSVEAVD